MNEYYNRYDSNCCLLFFAFDIQPRTHKSSTVFKLRIWRTHSVSMRTEWPISLFSSSNYAFDVHTVYQWALNDHYHYFQTTHLTYTQLVYQWGLNDRYRYSQTTHLTYTQCINEDWMTVIVIFKLCIWRTQFINENWIDCCLLLPNGG